MKSATLLRAVIGSALAAVVVRAASSTRRPMSVVVERKLIQKHAKMLGLPEPTVKLYKISGGANINKALLARQLDFGAAGVGPALKLWGKTKGRFKIAFDMTHMPLKLITNDPKVSFR